MGSASATNMFLSKGVRDGFFVPTAWDQYQVPAPDVLQVLGRLPNPMHRRLVSWSRALPAEARRDVCFAGPRLWRDTDLSEPNLLPVVPLGPDERQVPGFAPQWDAFYQDLGNPPERWRLEAGPETLAEFQVPSAADVAVLLAASLNPRWVNASRQLAATSADQISRLARIQEAPRGGKTASVGLGPPHQFRLLAPRWYLDLILDVPREPLLRKMLGWETA